MTAPKKTTATKKPQDRKPKAGDSYTVEVRGETLTIPLDALDDFELLDDLDRLNEGETQRLPAVLRRLLGDDYGRALDLLRDEGTGRVSLESGSGLVSEIFEALNPNS